jgi:hypothetical protein
VGDVRVIGSILSVSGLLGNDCHRLNANHAFESQVGLVSNYTGQL